MKKINVLLFVVMALATACEDDDKKIVITQSQELCDSLNISYTEDVAAILESTGCSGDYCHGSGAGGVNLRDWQSTKTAAESPKFLKAIRHELGASPMPKGGGKLSDADLEKIECWIKNGSRE